MDRQIRHVNGLPSEFSGLVRIGGRGVYRLFGGGLSFDRYCFHATYDSYSSTVENNVSVLTFTAADCSDCGWLLETADNPKYFFSAFLACLYISFGWSPSTSLIANLRSESFRLAPQRRFRP